MGDTAKAPEDVQSEKTTKEDIPADTTAPQEVPLILAEDAAVNEDAKSTTILKKDDSNVETVFENMDMSSEKSLPIQGDGKSAGNVGMGKPTVDIPPLEFELRDNTPLLKSDKLASDIFSLKESDTKPINSVCSEGASSGRMIKNKDLASSIFPAGCMGCKENASDNMVSPRRFLDAKEASECRAGYIDSTPRKRPTSSKPRNPITGGGIDLEDPRKSCRRKGNRKTTLVYSENY